MCDRTVLLRHGLSTSFLVELDVYSLWSRVTTTIYVNHRLNPTTSQEGRDFSQSRYTLVDTDQRKEFEPFVNPVRLTNPTLESGIGRSLARESEGSSFGPSSPSVVPHPFRILNKFKVETVRDECTETRSK